MNILQAFILSAVQGITEFLPVSSSGHLVILQTIMGMSEPPVLFDILVHIGSLVAVLIFFWKIIIKLSKKTILLIGIGTIPAVILGLFLNKYTEVIFNSITGVGISLLITSILLFSTLLVKDNNKDLHSLCYKDSFIIGLFQAVAILPGVSRSGSTIVGGILRKLKFETAFTFSFLLAIPAILGALVLNISKIKLNNNEFKIGLVGLVISAIFSLIAIKILKKVILRKKIYYFGFYCLILGLLILLKG
jgi:undecaprenyl-diphosphatase